MKMKTTKKEPAAKHHQWGFQMEPSEECSRGRVKGGWERGSGSRVRVGRGGGGPRCQGDVTLAARRPEFFRPWKG